ncbi:nucleotidyltransferase domain-containing protein [Sulfuricystis multivorans]|uniref:nucleotidyltransferase domain-containing protein n=1 Tax=Sulfuricystis multivorans TaxID=2211108 RepID=UPI001559DEA4|nr:nucleotidyltransferase family protein [Sulfuricystis multivorans]
MFEHNLLLKALIEPEAARCWSAADWGLAIRQARTANLVAALAVRLQESPISIEIPSLAQPIFSAARQTIAHRNETVLWECRQIALALEPIGVMPILLKGAAYVADGLPLAHHRHFGDIDVMVPRARLGEVETQLMTYGWLTTTSDAYDQRYYRQWMHEVPPLRQIHRGTTLDLHHALTPLTARYRADTTAVFAATRPAGALAGVLVLSDEDQFLHAAVHLFAEGEADAALRNLYDLVELLKSRQAESADFVTRLVARAQIIGLERPLFLAVHFLRRVFQLEGLEKAERDLADACPSLPVLRAMHALYAPLLQGIHPSVRSRGFALAKQTLYLRGHWLRMPLRLLLPHLLRKSWRALRQESETVS